ncbi:Fic family protein [bacterium]|nr:Fic family protein [bacterium]
MSFAASSDLHKKNSITRWDLFACVAGRPEGIALTRLAHVLHVERERSLIVPLGELEDEELIVCDSRDHYILSSKEAAKKLRYTIAYALAYDYDYNAYFSEDMVAFLKKAYRSDHFSTGDVSEKLMKPELITRLVHNDLLLIYKYEPFTGRIVENPFLDGLCDYLKIKRAKAFFFRKKISMGSVLEGRREQLDSSDSQNLSAARKFFSGRNFKNVNWGLTDNGKYIKESVEREDSELFDPESSACFQKAWNAMQANVSRSSKLSVDAIKLYHKLTMANTDIPSTYRDHDVMIGNNPNFKAAVPSEIPYKLSNLVNYLAAASPSDFESVLDVCAYAYNEFIHIHPFSDGNSRTARIVLAHILNLFHMPFEKIPHSFEVRFLIVTKGLKTRDDNELKYVLEEIYLNCMNRLELEKVMG